MNITIRTDSFCSIGTGHLMRCLTLADALKEKGANVHFICRDLQGNLSHVAEEHGHKLHLLPAPKNDFKLQVDNPPHASWLKVSWQDDLQDTQQITCSVPEKFDWLIVDSYALDYRWEQKMRSAAHKIMVIDDLADRKHDCDLLLDQNYFEFPETRYQNLVAEHCQKVLGPRYALLRPEFRQASKFCRMRGNGTVRIIVYFGGNDHDNLTGMALEALSCPELEHIYVDVVVGPHNSYMKNLKEQVNNRSKVRLYVQPEGFVELLLRADLCIGAGGTTTWERLCLSIQSIVITTALNQEAFTFELDKANLLHWIGSKNTISTQKIKSAVIQEISNNGSVDTMSMSNMVDGHGALRIAEILYKFKKNRKIFNG
jgi:UDP-2,4-diacetamido-2,4,6-trideoxy-beta-L-altropyranose hydrolase